MCENTQKVTGGRRLPLVPAYKQWFELLSQVPPLHVVVVANHYVTVSNYLITLIKRRYVRPNQFRFRKMKNGGCIIFHYSNHDFGRLVIPRSIRHQYDWSAIFASIPNGYGCEVDANWKTVHGAIWRHERQGDLKRGEFKVHRRRYAKRLRIILCHQSVESGITDHEDAHDSFLH